MTERRESDTPEEVRRPMPYGRQSISETDIEAVVEVLRSDYLTTGPAVERFERAMAEYVGTAEAVAVSSGTAALHCAMAAIELRPGDEVIVPTMTFAATANCVVYQGGVPVFADVRAETLLIDPDQVERLITPKTKALIAVDYAGQPCDYAALRAIAEQYGLTLVADASHALGAKAGGEAVGGLADLSTFSFHPVKPITGGEGGVVSTDRADWATRMRQFRNHGITQDYHQRDAADSWHYEMASLGFNYRLTDIQSALALSQLGRLDQFIDRRHEIALQYDKALASIAGVVPLTRRDGIRHAWHLYVVRIDAHRAGVDRRSVFRRLRAEGIHTGVHYIPVHLHPFYRERFGTASGLCPVAEAAYQEILSLPIYPDMSSEDVSRVVSALEKAVEP